MNKREALISAILSIGMLTQLSPQLRHVLGPFSILLISNILFLLYSLREGPVISRTARTFFPAILAGSAFIALAIIRLSAFFGDKIVLSSFIVYPGMILLFLTTLVALKNTNDRMLYRVQSIVFVVWTLSLGLGIPMLLRNPSAARQLTSQSGDFANTGYEMSGVGNFSAYAGYAIAFPILLNFAIRESSRLRRRIYLGLLLMGAASVFLSSFAMASFILMASVLMYLMAGLLLAEKKSIVYAISLSALLGIAMTWRGESRSLNALEKVQNKIGSIFGGIAKSGLIEGEPTNRMYWLSLEIKSFSESPITGYTPANNKTPLPIFYHSSLGDLLSLFGLPISFLWFGVLFAYFEFAINGTRDRLKRFGKLISIIVFIAAGILNPVWNNPTIIMGMAVFFLPEKDLPRGSA